MSAACASLFSSSCSALHPGAQRPTPIFARQTLTAPTAPCCDVAFNSCKATPDAAAPAFDANAGDPGATTRTLDCDDDIDRTDDARNDDFTTCTHVADYDRCADADAPFPIRPWDASRRRARPPVIATTVSTATDRKFATSRREPASECVRRGLRPAATLSRAVVRRREPIGVALWTPHDLRRTARTWLGKLGIPHRGESDQPLCQDLQGEGCQGNPAPTMVLGACGGTSHHPDLRSSSDQRTPATSQGRCPVTRIRRRIPRTTGCTSVRSKSCQRILISSFVRTRLRARSVVLRKSSHGLSRRYPCSHAKLNSRVSAPCRRFPVMGARSLTSVSNLATSRRVMYVIFQVRYLATASGNDLKNVATSLAERLSGAGCVVPAGRDRGATEGPAPATGTWLRRWDNPGHGRAMR
jgi:hypothetical protein